VHDAPGPRPARLHAGAARENDHHVLAEVFLLFLDAAAQPFARRYHQCDRNDAPGDAEHRQQRSALMRPERRDRIAQEVAERHQCPATGE